MPNATIPQIEERLKELSPEQLASVLDFVSYLAERQASPQLTDSTPSERDVTTQQAADVLNVPHTYLLDLLESGTIPFRASGSQRMIRERDLPSFKSKHDNERDEALAELTRLSQALGLYREGN